MGFRTMTDFDLTQYSPSKKFKLLILLVSITKWLPAACSRSQMFKNKTLFLQQSTCCQLSVNYHYSICHILAFGDFGIYIIFSPSNEYISMLSPNFHVFLWTLTNAFWKVSIPGTIDTCDFIPALDPVTVIATISGNLTISPVQKQCRKRK